jgi:NADPH:quinone reductase-like Zn-dependent oxidoreductase
MKALIFRETGEPKSVLELAEIPTPPLAPGKALVRVLLSPINASDLHMVRGRYGYQPELPASPGIEGGDCGGRRSGRARSDGWNARSFC